jgi:hypothetical protein
MKKEELIHKQLSLSGFPFQLRIENEIRLTERDHGWRVITREQAWTNNDAQNSGFIDIVLRHNHLSALRLLIECKRQRSDDARNLQWLFLIPEEDAIKKENVRCLSTVSYTRKKLGIATGSSKLGPIEDEYKSIRIWDDVRIKPASLESQFCVMHGNDSGRQPILESLCREILDSVDGLEEEEINIARSQTPSPEIRAFYIPILVTNAQLVTCTFKVDTISLNDGIIPKDKCELATVPFIRFRKSLANEFPIDQPLLDLQQANKARERTIFIVQSEGLVDFLKDWEIKPMDEFDGYAIYRHMKQMIS